MSSSRSTRKPKGWNGDHKKPREQARRAKTADKSTTDKHVPQGLSETESEALNAPIIALSRLFDRIERFGQEIDDAFAGQPFLLDLSPVDPVNRRRFKRYLLQHKQVTNLLVRAVHAWVTMLGREDLLPKARKPAEDRKRRKVTSGRKRESRPGTVRVRLRT